MTFLFVTSAPLIPLLGSLYFYIKYMIDKYNISEHYEKEFESQGELASAVTGYLIFTFFIFQIAMCGMCTGLFESEDLVIGSIIIAIGQCSYVMIFRWFALRDLEEVLYDPRTKENVRRTLDEAQNYAEEQERLLEQQQDLF